jgi:dienelactone hydrolase
MLATAVAGQERVKFRSLDADLTGGGPTELDGYLYRPPGEGPFPAVVALHGCGGLFVPGTQRISSRHRDWAERLSGLGYAVLLPDSLNPRGVTQVCTSRDPPVWPGRHRVRDAYGALDYLRAQPFIAADRVGVMGWSHGGSATLWTAGRAAAEHRSSDAGRFKVAIAFYPGCGDLDRRGWRAAIPVYILAGEADDWTPAERCRQLAERARAAGDRVEFTAYPDAPHGFDAPNQPRRTRTGVFTPSGAATVGTEPAARADALRRVRRSWRRLWAAPLIVDARVQICQPS